MTRRKDDNRWSNLKLVSRSSHPKEHREEQRAPLSQEQVRRALEGRSTAEAAELIGVHHQTLRNRFDHLLVKRRSPGETFSPDFVESVRKLAEDPSVGTRDAARRLNTTPNTLRECCRLHAIGWTSAPPGRHPSRK